MKTIQNGYTHYSSFKDIAEDWGCKPYTRRTKDMDKLKSQREKFLGECKVCHKPMYWVSGTNVMVCNNPECKGIKYETKNAAGEKVTRYNPVSKILDEAGLNIADTLFGE